MTELATDILAPIRESLVGMEFTPDEVAAMTARIANYKSALAQLEKEFKSMLEAHMLASNLKVIPLGGTEKWTLKHPKDTSLRDKERGKAKVLCALYRHFLKVTQGDEQKALESVSEYLSSSPFKEGSIEDLLTPEGFDELFAVTYEPKLKLEKMNTAFQKGGTGKKLTAIEPTRSE